MFIGESRQLSFVYQGWLFQMYIYYYFHLIIMAFDGEEQENLGQSYCET